MAADCACPRWRAVSIDSAGSMLVSMQGAPLALSATGGSIAPCASASFDRGVPLPLTQTQLASAVADRAEIGGTDAKRVLGVLEEIVLEELGNAQKVRIGGLVQLTVRVKPAQKAQGRAGTRPPARRSRSPPSLRASTFARPARKRRPACRRCRKRADDSPLEAGLRAPLGSRREHLRARPSRLARAAAGRLRDEQPFPVAGAMPPRTAPIGKADRARAPACPGRRQRCCRSARPSGSR